MLVSNNPWLTLSEFLSLLVLIISCRVTVTQHQQPERAHSEPRPLLTAQCRQRFLFFFFQGEIVKTNFLNDNDDK